MSRLGDWYYEAWKIGFNHQQLGCNGNIKVGYTAIILDIHNWDLIWMNINCGFNEHGLIYCNQLRWKKIYTILETLVGICLGTLTSKNDDFTKHWGFNDQYGWFMDDVYGSFGWDVFFWAPSEIRSAKRQDFRNKVMGTMRYPLVI